MNNQAKAILRVQVKEILKAMTPEDKYLQSKKIFEKIHSLPAYKHSKRVSIYLSTEMEVSTSELLKSMFHLKKQVFVPSYNRDEMRMLKIYDDEDYERLPVTRWKIKQPNIDDVSREDCFATGGLDLILVPGVVFTKSGGRVGHGKGYYDKFFSDYFKLYPRKTDGDAQRTLLIGLAFKGQIVESDRLPMEPHDFSLDLVVTSD